MNKTKITVRFDGGEYNHFKKISAASGLKMEPLIRKLIMGKSVCPRPSDDYYKLLHEINAIGVNGGSGA